MIKNIKIELIILGLIFLNIIFSYSVDIGLYNYFSQFSDGLSTMYLEEFFIDITNLGDSFWYFLTFIILFFLNFLLSKTKLVLEKHQNYIKHFSLACIVYLLTTGIVTQILKHLIGRHRPNHTNLIENFGFDFFTTNSNFHSFPSGHASTIFIISLIAGALLPKLRYFFYIFAIIVSLSRVVVGAHYTTDIVAGGLVAVIVFKSLNYYFNTNLTYLKVRALENKNINFLYYFLIVYGLVGLLLTVGPTLDLFFSNLFYFGKKQFLLQSYSITTIVFRDIMLPLILIYILILPIFSIYFPIKKIFFDYEFSFKNILFVWLSLIISILVVVNLLLKGLWGRARPNDIFELGGNGIYTPWYKISDSCLTNCSFVSGDASVGFSILVLFFITKKITYLYLAVILGSLLGMIRIAEGGHFLSDIVFSFFIITTSSMLMFYFYKKYYDK